MRLASLLVVCSSTFLVIPSSAHDEAPPELLGSCTALQLADEPFAEWSQKGYDEYVPNASVLEALGKTDFASATYTVYFGTWCGDSRREVPRMLKLFDAMGLVEDRVRLVALDRTPEALKRSPGGEERGREIYRVPTLIVERDGRELARLVEYPVLSLERDLLTILSGDRYEPSYGAYPVIRRWLAAGLLADPNVSAWGLAEQVRAKVHGEGDLAAAARVLQSRGDLAEAAKLFEVNCALHWESAACHENLAKALLDRGDLERAREHVERALRYNDDRERLERLTDLLDEIAGGAGS